MQRSRISVVAAVLLVGGLVVLLYNAHQRAEHLQLMLEQAQQVRPVE